MAPYEKLDAHAKPPENARITYKKYQKMTLKDIEIDADIVDFNRGLDAEQQRRCVKKGTLDSEYLLPMFQEFQYLQHLQHLRDTDLCPETSALLDGDKDYPVYECLNVPGLLIMPSLLPPIVQLALLNRLAHRDLSNMSHKTNVHTHYDVPYATEGKSFFSYEPTSKISFTAHEPGIHEPLSIQQFLSKKLRWVTLGGQYDWTRKVYPNEEPPPFPKDIAKLLEGLFAGFKSEAAIVNFYSPGDTLSMHRDVSEECDKGLVSISLGCDAIFVIAVEDPSVQSGVQCVPIRLRSGDAVYMTRASRFAWHGVPSIIPNTCPDWLKDWPATQMFRQEAPNPEYEQWRGWMASKRINLNVRQIWD